MLLALRDFISREGVVSTQQLARAFCIDEEALQPMLDIWVTKGVIEPVHEKTSCQSSCFRCKTNRYVYYQSLS